MKLVCQVAGGILLAGAVYYLGGAIGAAVAEFFAGVPYSGH